jgi:hypothetical protein
MRVAARFELPPELIRRSQVSQGRLVAPRPKDMSLDNAKARSALGHGLGSIDEFLAELHAQELRGRREELLRAVSSAVPAT